MRSCFSFDVAWRESRPWFYLRKQLERPLACVLHHAKPLDYTLRQVFTPPTKPHRISKGKTQTRPTPPPQGKAHRQEPNPTTPPPLAGRRPSTNHSSAMQDKAQISTGAAAAYAPYTDAKEQHQRVTAMLRIPPHAPAPYQPTLYANANPPSNPMRRPRGAVLCLHPSRQPTTRKRKPRKSLRTTNQTTVHPVQIQKTGHTASRSAYSFNEAQHRHTP